MAMDRLDDVLEVRPGRWAHRRDCVECEGLGPASREDCSGCGGRGYRDDEECECSRCLAHLSDSEFADWLWVQVDTLSKALAVSPHGTRHLDLGQVRSLEVARWLETYGGVTVVDVRRGEWSLGARTLEWEAHVGDLLVVRWSAVERAEQVLEVLHG
jgi:hypothetical protein